MYILPKLIPTRSLNTPVYRDAPAHSDSLVLCVLWPRRRKVLSQQLLLDRSTGCERYVKSPTKSARHLGDSSSQQTEGAICMQVTYVQPIFHVLSLKVSLSYFPVTAFLMWCIHLILMMHAFWIIMTSLRFLNKSQPCIKSTIRGFGTGHQVSQHLLGLTRDVTLSFNTASHSQTILPYSKDSAWSECALWRQLYQPPVKWTFDHTQRACVSMKTPNQVQALNTTRSRPVICMLYVNMITPSAHAHMCDSMDCSTYELAWKRECIYVGAPSTSFAINRGFSLVVSIVASCVWTENIGWPLENSFTSGEPVSNITAADVTVSRGPTWAGERGRTGASWIKDCVGSKPAAQPTTAVIDPCQRAGKHRL